MKSIYHLSYKNKPPTAKWVAFVFIPAILVASLSLGACSTELGSNSAVDRGEYYDSADYEIESEYTEDDLQTAYNEGWDENIYEIFDSSPSGSLYYGEDEYSASDFEGLAPTYEGWSGNEPVTEDDIDEARETGGEDAKAEVFSESPNGSFYYDDEEYSEYDF